MSKKSIVVLQGSPCRGGNTETLADSFINGAQQAGHKIVKFNVSGMNIQGCTGCHTCSVNEGICCINDDMQEISSHIYECDTLVLASPVYFFSFSAQIKAAIDRLETLTGKKLPITSSVLLTTYYQAPDSGAVDPLIHQYKTIANYLGWEDKGIIAVPHMDDVGDIADHPMLAEARALGRRL